MATTFEIIGSVIVGSGGAANIEFTSIPSTYTDIKLVCSLRGTTGNVDTALILNNNTSNYTWLSLYGYGTGAAGASGSTTASSSVLVNASTYTANTFGNAEIYFPNYAGSNYKSTSMDTVIETNAAVTYMAIKTNLWSNTAAITSIKLQPDSGDFVQYSTAYLYGIKNT
jgi:hypothetical protein